MNFNISLEGYEVLNSTYYNDGYVSVSAAPPVHSYGGSGLGIESIAGTITQVLGVIAAAAREAVPA